MVLSPSGPDCFSLSAPPPGSVHSTPTRPRQTCVVFSSNTLAELAHRPDSKLTSLTGKEIQALLKTQTQPLKQMVASLQLSMS